MIIYLLDQVAIFVKLSLSCLNHKKWICRKNPFCPTLKIAFSPVFVLQLRQF